MIARRFLQIVFISLFATSFGATTALAQSAANRSDPVLGPGDVIKLTVYQNPDLSVDSRVTELGQITVPLIGAVKVGGLTVPAAQSLVEKRLRDGGFVLRPQVTIQTTQIRSLQVSILGQVSKPGRYPIEIVGTKVSEIVAAAGGVVPGGADVVTLVGKRNGKQIKFDIDLPAILQAGQVELDVPVENGDIIYVDRAPTYYVSGEVQRPGQFRLERGMTVQQALSQAGGISLRGTERGMRVTRRDAAGKLTEFAITASDTVEPDDVIYVKESLF